MSCLKMGLLLQKLKNVDIRGHFSVAHWDRRVLIFCHDIIALFAAMQLSMWLVLRDELSLLDPGFVIKESLIFALISSGFFLWFQTYKGVWRYVSWRQSALIAGVLGFASLIFFPLLTKAHMQPISIPAVTVLVNWGVASTFLIGSRVFFKVFHERWSVADESLLTDIPLARVILVGAGPGAKAFLKHLNRQKIQLYDVLGYVETNPKLDTTLEGIDGLGSLADLPDLIENFNSEGLHPHHIVFTDSDYFGSKAQALLKNLAPFKVGFMALQKGRRTLSPLTIEDVFYKKTGEGFAKAFADKNVLIYGATCALGQKLSKIFVNSSCSTVVLWDQNASALVDLKKGFASKKVVFFSKSNCAKAQLVSYLKEHKIDLVVNLKSFAALEVEPYDPSLSFEVYVEENEQFAMACEKAGVGNYYFITQEAPHGPLARQLSPVANHVLKGHSKSSDKISKSVYAVINLPYVLSQKDCFFQGSSHFMITKNELPVVSPAYGAYMLGRIISDILTNTSWTGRDKFQMDTRAYSDIAILYSRLNHNAPKPAYSLKETTPQSIKWNEEYYKVVQRCLKNMDYKGAVETLNSLYA